MWHAATLVAALFLVQAGNQPDGLKPTAVKPFIVYQVERSSSYADPERRNPVVTPWMVARRSDGSEVSSFTSTAPDGSQVESREITDIQQGRYFMLNVSAKTVTTFYYAPVDLSKNVQANLACPAEANSPSATRTTLLGHPTVVFKRAFSGDTENVKAALDLDCYPLYNLQTFASGSVNEFEVTSIAGAEYAQRYPGHSVASEDYLRLIDQRYYSHRAPAPQVQ